MVIGAVQVVIVTAPVVMVVVLVALQVMLLEFLVES